MARPYETLTDIQLIDLWEKETKGTDILSISIIATIIVLLWQYLRLAFWVMMGMSAFYVTMFWIAFPPKKTRHLEKELKVRYLW